MRKRVLSAAFAALLLLSLSAAGFAEEKQGEEQPVDPSATNLTAAYPLFGEATPQMPEKPASLQDAKAVTAYIAAVDAYLKAVQKYIDGTTNDLNKIIEERNKAIASANQAVADYNAFFEENRQK